RCVDQRSALSRLDRALESHARPYLAAFADVDRRLVDPILVLVQAAILNLDPDLARQSIEVALPEFLDRADVVPVVVDLVPVEGDVLREERREDVLRPVDEVAVGEVVEDLRLEDVDAAVAEIRERLRRIGFLLEALDAP